ncbi:MULTISPECIES: hypothetical protein [Streptomyces]|uniref:hypothetical protein n=1 Tax=Streptomyces TaxID=1883 RepID=UPI00163C1C51|nr:MULTISPECIES: hypothetical protein [Streptomyces]MBC2876801.1 hypothetical protein [Streptomyces sp. TYQ1024]UBI36424.1 hypothetical protein K7I03_08065 [Streptomyces mobaraensis]UKW29016.1 hypothetical protein MCU78_08050 [Streptomyces sp. TYQ1024]
MGVFSWLRRKPSQASTEEAATDTLTAEPDGGAGTDEAADENAAAAEAVTAGSTEETGAAEGGEGVEGVDIPKQQSADEAADSEAGEGARK